MTKLSQIFVKTFPLVALNSNRLNWLMSLFWMIPEWYMIWAKLFSIPTPMGTDDGTRYSWALIPVFSSSSLSLPLLCPRSARRLYLGISSSWASDLLLMSCKYWPISSVLPLNWSLISSTLLVPISTNADKPYALIFYYLLYYLFFTLDCPPKTTSLVAETMSLDSMR